MEQTIETWRSVVEYEGFYQVSDLGNVRSVSRVVNHAKGKMRLKARVMKPRPALGYERVCLHQNAIKKYFFIHRLVATAFLGRCPIGRQINHIDGCKLNNRLSNLEFVTARENMQHAWRSGLFKARIGVGNPSAKLTEENVLAIRAAYEAGGVTMKKLADNFGVGRSQISNIIHRRRWPYLLPA